MEAKDRMPTDSLIEHTQHIGSGIRNVGGCERTGHLESSGGAVMCVWDRCVPHSRRVCMYEICTEGFILPQMKLQCVLVEGKADSGTYHDVSVTRLI